MLGPTIIGVLIIWYFHKKSFKESIFFSKLIRKKFNIINSDFINNQKLISSESFNIFINIFSIWYAINIIKSILIHALNAITKIDKK